MKQQNLFGDEYEKKDESEYTSIITTPIYKPSLNKPHLFELVDTSKRNRLINEINTSNVSEDEKKFLINAAYRHNIFYYEKIADYYAHATKEMQQLMEKSALVVIDFNQAYEHGYITLAYDLANQYFDHHGK